jgi:hypothetical protein
MQKVLVACFAAFALFLGSPAATQAATTSESSKEARQALLAKIEALEQRLRTRDINIAEFQAQFSKFEEVERGPKYERVIHSRDTRELRSALDSFKSDLKDPWAWWVWVLVVIGVIIAVLIVLALIFGDRDGGFLLLLIILCSGGGNNDF